LSLLLRRLLLLLLLLKIHGDVGGERDVSFSSCSSISIA
jgi:hypothetical protein